MAPFHYVNMKEYHKIELYLSVIFLLVVINSTCGLKDPGKCKCCKIAILFLLAHFMLISREVKKLSILVLRLLILH